MEKVIKGIPVVKICSKNCKECAYHGYSSSMIVCNYILIEGHSRIFENKKRRDIPKGYCDKFIPKENANDKVKNYSASIHSSVIIQKPKEIY